MYKSYLETLLDKVKENMGEISPPIEKAYSNTPRHLFVEEFLEGKPDGEIQKIVITSDNLEEYLPKLYNDGALCLAIDEDGSGISSISQPTIVLMMLQKLDLQEGQKVLEIGTASGWNAAMMSQLVGTNGQIFSIEILSELAAKAKAKIAQLNLQNVQLFDGDGAVELYQESFDRIMFTVGSYDVPQNIFRSLKDGGLLLMVLKHRGPFDGLILFKKVGNHLESIENSICRFVPLKGAYAMNELDDISLELLPIWERLKDKEVAKQDFWWGSNYQKQRINNLKISGISSFLAITEPNFQLFKTDKHEMFFGLMEEEHGSMAIWKDNQLTAYGNEHAFNRLKKAFDLYFKLGMPSSSCLKIKVYPKEEAIKLEENQWLIQRRDAQFLWSLS